MGDDFIATCDDQPVIVVPVAAVLDADSIGLSLVTVDDHVPEDWTESD